jgi:hypothetical protein
MRKDVLTWMYRAHLPQPPPRPRPRLRAVEGGAQAGGGEGAGGGQLGDGGGAGALHGGHLFREDGGDAALLGEGREGKEKIPQIGHAGPWHPRTCLSLHGCLNGLLTAQQPTKERAIDARSWQ